jgi:hypothetical protein
MLGNLEHGLVHSKIILPRGNNQIGPGHQSPFTYFVMVEEGAARRFNDVIVDARRALAAFPALGPSPRTVP